MVRRTSVKPGVDAVLRGRSHVVDRSEAGKMRRRDDCGNTGARWPPAQRLLDLRQPLGNRRTGADRHPDVADDAVAVDDDVHRHHGNGNDEIAPRSQLAECRAAANRSWHRDCGDDFPGTQRRLPIAGDEARQRQAARPARSRLQFNFGIERQQRRHAIGGGRRIAEVAGDRSGILDLQRTDLAGGGLEAIERRLATTLRRCRSRSRGHRNGHRRHRW